MYNGYVKIIFMFFVKCKITIYIWEKNTHECNKI